MATIWHHDVSGFEHGYGTAAEFATFKATGKTVSPGSDYWTYDTKNLYKTYDGTNWEIFIPLG